MCQLFGVSENVNWSSKLGWLVIWLCLFDDVKAHVFVCFKVNRLVSLAIALGREIKFSSMAGKL